MKPRSNSRSDSGTWGSPTPSAAEADSGRTERETTPRSDIQQFGYVLVTGSKAVYRHITGLVVVSVCWFVASLPLVTIGPATVGAYAAVSEILENERLDPSHSLSVVRQQFFPSLVLGLLPLMFTAGAVVTFLQYGQTGATTALYFAVASAYAAAFAAVVLIPTFVALADGEWGPNALKRGYVWTVTHPTLALFMGFLTLVHFVAMVLLTVGIVLLYAGVAFAFHYLVVIDDL